MTEADFEELERDLVRPIPRRYRELMAAYPLDPGDANSRIALDDDVRSVLAWNAELREGEWSAEWSADRFAIGCSPCGDTYFLDLAGSSPAVFVWDHETHRVTQEAADLDEFVAQQKRYEEEARASRASRPTARRRWWWPWGAQGPASS
ncbi:MAG: SMI1/KNR4 family protein [Isosphaeraceae bacterium]